MRFDRSSALLFFIIICLFLNSCSRTSGTYSDIEPSSTPALPLPDIDSMIERIATQDGCRDFSALMRMTSLVEGGKKDQVEFSVQRKYTPARVSTFLSVIAPRQETDKAILAFEQPDQATQAFSYLPGLKKLNKFNSEKQLGFHGSTVTVQELLGMELSQYTHNAGERVMKGEEPAIKVEFKEKPYFGLGFPRIVAYFREKDGEPQDFELYDMRNELQKRIAIVEIKTIQNRRTITKISINDLSQKLKLELNLMKIEYDRDLPESIFTTKHLIEFISNAGRILDQDRKGG
ncbi:MAG: outer membrane lipoprotein-sorting protein [Blastocatellia bacterium]|nr:outer membrane lipoprotein-sorting protein [Blastocatellia bacterium]